MIVKTLEQTQPQDQTTYQLYAEVTKVDPVTEMNVVINELARQGRLDELTNQIENLDQQISNLTAQKTLYQGYKTEIEAL